MSDAILLERQGAVATITLNRPDAGNAIDLPIARALLEAAIACDEDPAVRCVLLTGAGRLFCVGGDVAAFARQSERLPAYIKEITTYLHGALVRFARMGKPMVTAINGPAAGAGIGLAAIGDIALAAPEAHFTLAYTAIGMSPDGGATWLLPRLIGMRRTQELVLRNRRVQAGEAAEIGLVTRVTESGQTLAEASALAEELAAGATSAFGTSRRLLLDSLSASLETQLDAESRGIAGQARNADGREGIAAFLGKRPPIFTGA
jgi:2-(1,2-epoxy-1,2-dihydrophenyl)acetyl-CoA isomerase